MNTQPTREQVLSLLHAFVGQRSGIDYQNYGERSSFMGDYNTILKDGKTARIMLQKIEWSSMTVETLLTGFSAFSGRLQITEKDGEFRLDYCTGQYFPTEYRAAVCAVLASALWSHYREDSDTGESMRKKFRKMFGRGIASRWFN
jgi:hypothetical protein